MTPLDFYLISAAICVPLTLVCGYIDGCGPHKLTLGDVVMSLFVSAVPALNSIVCIWATFFIVDELDLLRWPCRVFDRLNNIVLIGGKKSDK